MAAPYLKTEFIRVRFLQMIIAEDQEAPSKIFQKRLMQKQISVQPALKIIIICSQ